MKKQSVETIVAALNAHQVRYLIVGGLAVVAHGYVRLTVDIDLVLAVSDENLTRAVKVLKALGFCPRAPVPIEHFTDPAKRRQWATEKNMLVFSLFSPEHGRTEVDLFLEPPFDFDSAYAKSIVQNVAPGVPAVFCGIDDLLALKARAGRPRDLEDIAQLQMLHRKDAP